MVTKVEVGERINEDLGISRYKVQAAMYKIDNYKVLLYSTGSCIQYLVINYNGKEYIYSLFTRYNMSIIYIYIYHFAVHQKLTL